MNKSIKNKYDWLEKYLLSPQSYATNRPINSHLLGK